MLIKHKSKHCHAPKPHSKYLVEMYFRSCLSLKWPSRRSLVLTSQSLVLDSASQCQNLLVSGSLQHALTHLLTKSSVMPTLFKATTAEARPILEDNLTKAETYTNLPFV